MPCVNMNNINQKNKNIITNSLRLIRQCPVCQTKYEVRKVQVVDLTETGVLVYFSCPICFSSLIAQIVEAPFGMVGSAMLTDLEAGEVKKFKDGDGVTADDVLEVYERLESNRVIE